MRNEPVCITNGAGLCEEFKKALRELFGPNTVFKNEGEFCTGYANQVTIPDIEDATSVAEFIADAKERIRKGETAIPGYMYGAVVLALCVAYFGYKSIINGKHDVLQPAKAMLP